MLNFTPGGLKAENICFSIITFIYLWGHSVQGSAGVGDRKQLCRVCSLLTWGPGIEFTFSGQKGKEK